MLNLAFAIWSYNNCRRQCAKSVLIRSFFWSVFSRIWTEYGEIRSISPNSVRMLENMNQKKLRILTLHAVRCSGRLSNIFIWYETSYNQTNLWFGKFCQLHRLYFYQTAKHYGFSRTFITTWKTLPSNYLNLNVKIEYPLPYNRKIWGYNRSETDSINRSIESFDWSYLFSDKSAPEQEEIFS